MDVCVLRYVQKVPKPFNNDFQVEVLWLPVYETSCDQVLSLLGRKRPYGSSLFNCQILFIAKNTCNMTWDNIVVTTNVL